jgi:hypothetical protein
MDDKKQRGRPKKTDNDTIGLNKKQSQDIPSNYDIPDTDIPDTDIPNTESNDDLKGFIKNKKVNNSNSDTNDLDDELSREIDDFEQEEGLNDIPDDYNPLNEPVKKRGYTDGNMGIDDNASQVGKTEGVISEPNYKMGGHARKPDIDNTLINPSNSGGDGVLDIPDDYNPYNDNKNNNNGGGSKKSSGNSSSNSISSSNSSSKKEKGGNFSELSPKEQREQVEKTADVILLAYKQYLPIPFVYFGTHDIKKLKKLEEKDEIDLGAVVNKKGETLLEYIKEFNDSVEETFKISDAEIEMIRPALVDVLMERETAFTPTQRLMFTLGQLVIAKIMMLVKFIRAKSADLKEFRQMHEENKEQRNTIIRQQEEIRKQNEEILKMRNEQAKAQAQTQPQTQAKSNLKVINGDEEEEIEVEQPTLDDALNTDTTSEVENEGQENDIP